ncbi:IS30 family transposase [Novosphingobium colocasiae]
MKPSTASSTLSSNAPTTPNGGSTCPVPRSNAAGAPRADGQERTEKCSIHDRPKDIASRQIPGHWEADCMLFRTPGPAVLIAHERHSRIVLAIPQQRLRAQTVADSLANLLKPLAPNLRQSITFDNGAEFYRHHQLTSQLGIHTYFCDPRAPWQKGGIEKRHRPPKTRASHQKSTPPRCPSSNSMPSSQTTTTRPEKCLGFKTPAETFNPLHFGCESTPASVMS